ncbi:MAG: cytidine deaminase [Solirubrobacteraceae bacterium]|nr:cytidine deaminase [Solirubrobacteraceae bacterium]
MTREPRRNVELKAVDRDPAATLSVAIAAGARDRGTLRQRDTYFGVPHGRLKLREQEGAVAQLIAYERPDDPAVRLSRYHLIEVPDPETALAGLTATCGVRVVVSKARRLLEWENVRIHLDDVAGLGRFVELEAVAAPGADLGQERRKVDRLRELLDIRDGDLRAGSYADALLPAPDPELLRLARAVAMNAYAPYSQLHIGAAVRTEDGRRYAGANVENAAYPQGWCAEASALGAMVAGGGGRIAEVVVASSHAVTPCGGCRQKLAEFAGPDAVVHLAGAGGVERTTTLGELLPLGFGSADLPG